MAADHGIPEAHVHVGRVTGMPKMSDVLKDWAAPLLEPLRGDLPVFRKGVVFAALIWNAATTMTEPAGEVASHVIDLAGSAGRSTSEEMRELVEFLIVRRRDDFGQDRRLVVATEVHDGGDEYRISVASAVPGDPRSLPE
jgi:hypothetical protein